MQPIPREKVLKALEKVARSSSLKDQDVGRAKNLSGGQVRYSALGREVSEQELDALKKWMRQHGAQSRDIERFERELGIKRGGLF